ncbi:MATE family efflux transporter [Paenibacillus spongiae]|uniref:MATE family efflux transporter n=1 Tax=Paenibacillus spongiae TaxID=2909671 RepID=A0ABY5S816_9BACL|nr:MATE family efflux transporter [Paenibacillus spongiae]UVI30066.1 MATE family efflux transporter [Paenibacillus spongiae]
MEHAAMDNKAGGVSLNLYKLTWPIFLELLLFMMMGTADTLMLSGVSDDAVSAVGVVNQYIFICILIMEVISNGASVVVAQYIGSRRMAEASKIAALAITMNLVLGLAVSAALFGFSDAILSSMNLEGQVLAYAKTYMDIVGGFIFIQALINVLASLIRTYGFTKESMYVAFGMNVVHVGLNFVLIFGYLGFPEMGVAGAAVSTVISRALAFVVFAWVLYRVMEVRIALRDYVTFSKTYMRKILSVGIPSALEQVTYHACQTVFLYYVTFLGAEALASRSYAMTISQYIYLFSAAIGMGTAIIVGRYVGAKLKDQAYRRVMKSVVWSLSITIAVDLVIIAFREPLVNLFTDSAEVIRMTTQVILFSILLETGRSINLVFINALRAAGDAKFPVYMGFISMVCMSLPLGYLLVFKLDMGLPGVWIAIAADEWLRGIIMSHRWRSRVWEKRSLVEPLEPAAAAAAGSGN